MINVRRLPKDKKGHIIVGFLISFFSTAFLVQAMGEPGAIAIGLVLAVVAGIAKEAYDYFHPEKHTTEFADIIATCVGGLLATFICLLLYLPAKENINMALNSNAGATSANNVLIGQITKHNNNLPIKSNADIAKEFAAAYHGYAKSATLAGADCSAGGTLSILETAFVNDNTPATIDRIALGLCNYWSSFNTVSEDPAHEGDYVISVVVNGASVLEPMKAAVTALVTNQSKPDGWLDFYNATQAVVNVIPCTVTEMMPGSPPAPMAFVETIS